MIIFLYGQDSYRINQKLNELIHGYKIKNPSGLNLIKLDLAENTLEDFFEAIKSSSLIPEKKLIILKNILSAKGPLRQSSSEASETSPKGGKADPEALLNFFQPKADPPLGDGTPGKPLAEKSQNLNKRDDVILIIIASGEPNKSKLFEYLIKKPNQAQNFKLLKEYEIKSWARQFSDSLGIDLTGEALDFLISNCGIDLWQLDSEIRKLADFSAKGGKIKGVVSKSQVEELMIPSVNYKIFELTDALAKRDKKRALGALFRALDNGEKPTELLGILAWQIRNLLRFKLNPDKPSDLKLHPFVLEKTREAAKLFSIDELNAIFAKIIDLDLAFKTGDMNEKTALSLLIAEL